MLYRWILAAQLGYVGALEAEEEVYKRQVFEKARTVADQLGKPLLNYGCGPGWGLTAPFWRYAVENSDINADIYERPVPNFVKVEACCQVDARLPFEDKSVVVFCSHVLEHVDNPDQLLKEFNRISDHVFIVVPHPLFPITWLHPQHKRVYVGSTPIEGGIGILGPILIGINLALLGVMKF